MHKETVLDIHPCYQGILQEFLTRHSFEAPLDEAATGKALLSVVEPEITLSVLVDKASHKIEQLSHSQAPSEFLHALIESFCFVAIDRTVQDISEHGAIHLETFLRDPEKPKPVSGIIMPENADKAFSLPAKISKRIMDLYIQETGFELGDNFDTAHPSDEWLKHTKTEQADIIKRVIPKHCTLSGIDREDVEIKNIEYDVRVTIAINKKVDETILYKYIVSLERKINKRIDRRLELYLGNIKDDSSIRRDIEANINSGGT